ncbi:MAG TPA: bifunctional methylenetetrahydrofolate dehydrogenase/methenyltetrahydrofolate cyclohydrolase FolD [Candidatus Ozemobacteraceae bacterium]|nr:bifunctional methylenetetrahydrofolate dehydrogenase/methenyltetrahydrofolate cyclohydrolase FolD [Candidatus Ozemobacteraceae bacterium]HQG29321.1 bifunctional methylenetetrahydrofolate dehydrogenase/methenyltetrahydrofolate cyclohydrolase FolD [Candidatus Ozemobacteraceae bacterium]
MATIIDGAGISRTIREEIRQDVQALAFRQERLPGLAVILVGQDPASEVYVSQKRKACEAVGFVSREIKMPETTSQGELIGQIRELNDDIRIHGILVQLPLPKQIDEYAAIEAIDPTKDVDGFHPVNVGRLSIGTECFAPCTPLGVIEMIRRTGIDIAGKRALVVGRSNIVGKPLAVMLMKMNATVTVAHSRTQNLQEEVSRADIVCAAVGKPRCIPGAWIKPGAVVIDVGTNSVPNPDKPGAMKLVGDVEFETAAERASYITPVPGGVGPMTIAMLLSNTLKARNALFATPHAHPAVPVAKER